jgi:hypothetical protein
LLISPDAHINAVPAASVLIAGEVLPLARHLELAALAGASLAGQAEKQGKALSVEAEQRLVFAPVKLFTKQTNQLTDPDRQHVAATLAATLTMCARAIAAVTVKRNNALVAQWRQLDREPAPDYKAGRRIVARRLELLDQLDRWVARCRPYLTVMENLPVDETARNEIRDLVSELSTMSTRARRSLA